MNKLAACALCAALTFCVMLAGGGRVFADDHVAPVGLDRDKMAGIGLPAIPPDAFQDILVSGQLHMRVATLFQGKELHVSVFESTPAKTDHRKRATDVDEFVTVLSGKLILTEPNGTRHEYRPGDSLVLPVGYRGTWEMQGNYRELVVEMAKGR